MSSAEPVFQYFKHAIAPISQEHQFDPKSCRIPIGGTHGFWNRAVSPPLYKYSLHVPMDVVLESEEKSTFFDNDYGTRLKKALPKSTPLLQCVVQTNNRQIQSKLRIRFCPFDTFFLKKILQLNFSCACGCMNICSKLYMVTVYPINLVCYKDLQ